MKPDNNEIMSIAAKMAQALVADELICEKRLASRWDISVKTLRKSRGTGALIPHIKLGRAVRYSMMDILAYESAQRRSSTSDVGGGR